MKLTELFLDEIVREGEITRRALERVPDGRSEWKPHDKSMPLGRLAGMIAMMPAWVAMMLEKDEFDLNPPGGGTSSFSQELRTSKELVEAHDKSVAGARTALQKANEQDLLTSWRLLVAGNVVQEKPRHIMIRDTISHLAHHRGQLTVYLRLNDVPVPSTYGPTADENRF